jgi:aldehyde dehydrogenase (NAD+)
MLEPTIVDNSYYNSARFGLSSAIVTNNLSFAMQACKQLKTGTTDVNEVPSDRRELTPFGGTRDSGLGVKEGVIEAITFFTHEKIGSLSW